MSKSIPIKNIFYLLIYAWDRYQEGKSINLEIEKAPDLPNLLSNLLFKLMCRVIKKGLDKDYFEENETSSFIKGKILFNDVIKKNLIKQGKLSVQIDNLGNDTQVNRYIKATLLKLKKNKNLEINNKKNLSLILRFLDDVKSTNNFSEMEKSIKLNKNNSYYVFPLQVCKMINNITIPSKNVGEFIFKDFRDDELRMSEVFEKFVRNFYATEQKIFRVKKEKIKIDAQGEQKFMDLMPSKETDVTLRSKNKTIVIDTKYYKEPLKEHYGKFKPKSDNINQVSDYLKNMEKLNYPDNKAEGILLYPVVSTQKRIERTSGMYQGHKLTLYSLNLNQDWKKIHNDLLNLVDLN